MSILTEIIQLLTGGITSFASAIGSGISELAQGLFLTTTGSGADAVTSLSVFGQLIVIFAGISLVISLCTLIFHWLTSLGARN